MDDEPKLGWKTVDLDHELAAAHLEEEISSSRPHVMIYRPSRRGRSHLRLHRDQRGFFVYVGSRGHDKQYLGRCKITFHDGEPTLFQFTFAQRDAYEAEERRRWEAMEARRDQA